jgi:hypothetical protein
MSTPTERPGGDSVRLIFTYEQGTVRLVSQHRVDIAFTGFDAAPHDRPGDFVEVRDAAGSSLTRVPIHSGLDTSIEVFPEDPRGQIVRVEAPELKRVFTVVVPARDAAESVAVVRIGAVGAVDGAGGVDSATATAAGLVASTGTADIPAVTELASFALDRPAGASS